MPSDLDAAILRTVAYFAYFSYPLTAFELWKWLLKPAASYSYLQVLEALETSEYLRSRVKKADGFWSLGDAAGEAEERSRRYVDAIGKYRTLKPFMRYAAHIPGVQGVAVCNSLAFHHTNAASDIDLFIVTKPGGTWTARFFAALPLMIFRKRPGETQSNPLCLSFFAADTALDLSSLKIGEEDPYLAYWSLTLMPLFDRSKWQRKFLENNAWIQELLPHAHAVRRAPAFRETSRKWVFPRIFSEVLLKKVQENRLPARIRAMMNVDTRVVVRDDMLKFHDHDRRAEIERALHARVTALL